MKYLFYPCLCFCLLSCAAPKLVALKGNYATAPRVMESDKSFDQVWDKLIDLFAQKGLSIKVIDRSSGLIVSERAILSSTTEYNSGLLKDSAAFIVVPKIYNRYTKKFNPVHESITGEWNVRIKKSDKKTLINVNLVNVKTTTASLSAGRITEKEIFCTSCLSTGVFENLIYNMIR